MNLNFVCLSYFDSRFTHVMALGYIVKTLIPENIHNAGQSTDLKVASHKHVVH